MTPEDYIDRMNSIVHDMLEYYSNHRRGAHNGICSYDAGCAVAWACGFKADVSYWDREGGVMFKEIYNDYVDASNEETLWSLFRPEYRLRHVEFWRNLQHLHDNDVYWNISSCDKFNTLSNTGQDCLDKIRSQFSDWAEDLANTEVYNDC